MPTSKDAIKRHIMYCLTISEMVNNLFLEEKTQERSVNIFDRIQGQIDLAMIRVLQQDPNNETEIVLARFVDAISQVGMARYSVQETLIPLAERKLLAAKRLGWKDLEADALDGLGILYAFLGYLQQAVQYFEMAYQIALKIKNKELKRDIQTHLKMAQKQTGNRKTSSMLKFPSLFRLISFRLKALIARIYKNPFSQVAALNGLAGIYLDFQKWDLSIDYYQQAIAISHKHSYRFGELEASIGQLQAEMTRGASTGVSLLTGMVGNLASEFGFKWSRDFSVFEILFEIAPAIRDAETISRRLARNNDPRAGEILGLLDQIMTKINEIVSAAIEDTSVKDEIFIDSLVTIKNNLANIVKISSQNLTTMNDRK